MAVTDLTDTPVTTAVTLLILITLSSVAWDMRAPIKRWLMEP